MQNGYCSTCKNKLYQRTYKEKIHHKYRQPGWFYTEKLVTQDYCPYCEWKGATGPGKHLREIIAQNNHKE